MPEHADFVSAIPDVLGRFGYWPTSEAEPVAGGTLNWNFRVESDGGAWFVRRYRDNLETPRIIGEHQLVRWAEDRGVPAPLPEMTPEDLSVVEIAGGRWAIFPWIDGEVAERGSLSPTRARTLGALHGYTQSVLARHPASEGATMQMAWDKAQSVAYLARIRAVAAERDTEQRLLDALARQASMLEDLEVLPPSGYASLPVQVLHGDFHDHQVLWDGDNIAALVDWEIWHTDPRVWEVIRSLAFALILESPRLEDYLAGYREHVHLSEEECRLGLRLWWQSRVVGMWAWGAYFLEGNTRVSKFFPALVKELELVADEKWKSGIEQRFVRAACG